MRWVDIRGKILQRQCRCFCVRLSSYTNAEHSFLGSIYKFFVRPGHLNKLTAWLQPEISGKMFFPKTHALPVWEANREQPTFPSLI